MRINTTDRQQKLFAIGYHKTGTSSLAIALQILGYRVTGPRGVFDPLISTRALSIALDLVQEYDAFQDNPWPLLYKDLDRLVPKSRFILTVRPSEPWIRSVVRHFGGTVTPMREWIYGAGDPTGHETEYVRRYEAHNQSVRQYFRQRPRDLLVMDITQGDGWEQLCDFLGCATPDVPFPVANTAEWRESWTSQGLECPDWKGYDVWRSPS